MSDTKQMNYCISSSCLQRLSCSALPSCNSVGHQKHPKRENPKVADLPVIPKLHPNDLLVTQLLASFTVIAIPASLGHVNAETLGVEGRWAGLAAQQLPTLEQRNLLGLCSKDSAPAAAATLRASPTPRSRRRNRQENRQGIRSDSTMLVQKGCAVQSSCRCPAARTHEKAVEYFLPMR